MYNDDPLRQPGPHTPTLSKNGVQRALCDHGMARVDLVVGVVAGHGRKAKRGVEQREHRELMVVMRRSSENLLFRSQLLIRHVAAG